jgi:hypothetical protein
VWYMVRTWPGRSNVLRAERDAEELPYLPTKLTPTLVPLTES